MPSPKVVRSILDSVQVRVIKMTRIVEGAELPHGPPSEAQKLRANIAVTLFGSLALALLVLGIDHSGRRAESAAEREKIRLEALNRHIDSLGREGPETILLTKNLDKLRIAVSEAPAAEYDSMLARYEVKREELVRRTYLPLACKQVDMFLKHKESRDALHEFEVAYIYLHDQTDSVESLEIVMEIVNQRWDKFFETLNAEFVGE